MILVGLLGGLTLSRRQRFAVPILIATVLSIEMIVYLLPSGTEFDYYYSDVNTDMLSSIAALSFHAWLATWVGSRIMILRTGRLDGGRP